MKRFLALLAACILLGSFSIASAADYSSMTDVQLKEQFDAIRNELTIRGFKAENKTIIFDEANIQIYISGDLYIGEPNIINQVKFHIPVVIVNNSQKNINIYITNSSINGWTCEAHLGEYSIPSGKKLKTTLYYYIHDLLDEIENTNDFTDAEFTLYIEDSSDWSDIIRETEKITIYAQ